MYRYSTWQWPCLADFAIYDKNAKKHQFLLYVATQPVSQSSNNISYLKVLSLNMGLKKVIDWAIDIVIQWEGRVNVMSAELQFFHDF